MHNAKFSTKCRKCLNWLKRNPYRPKSVNRVPLVTTFNPRTTFIAEIAKRNWNFLQSKERLSLIFKKPPLVAYRRPKSLRNRLVRSRFVSETHKNLITTACRVCETTRCSWCNNNKQTSTFTSPKKHFYHISCSGLPFFMDRLHNRVQHLQNWQKWNNI